MLVDVRKGTVTIATPGTAGTVTEVLKNAQFGNWVVQAPALDGTGTATVRMIDPLLGTISEVITNESTTKLGTPSFTFYDGTLTITATASNGTDGTQSVSRAVLYNIYYAAKQG